MFSIIIFFLAVTLVGLIAIQRSLVSYRREQMFIETRINAINSHYDSVIRDLGKTIEGSTQRALLACVNNISQSNPPLPLQKDANITVKELIINGTLDGEKIFMMENSTVPYWIQKIAYVSTLRGFDVDINTGKINETLVVKPYSSFYLLVEAYISINITDMQGVSALNRTTRISKTVSIEGLEDPLYVLYFHDLSKNYVWESPYIGNYTQVLIHGSDGGNGDIYGDATKTGDFVGKILVVENPPADLSGALGVVSKNNFPDPGIPYVINDSALDIISEGQSILLNGSGTSSKVWYIENLKKHIDGETSTNEDHSYYQASGNGPSYLDRLEGEFEVQDKYSSQTDNTIGLESFVDKTIFPEEFSPEQEKTNIDYFYFSTSTTGNKVKGVSDSNWFRMDSEHHQNYSVELLIE